MSTMVDTLHLRVNGKNHRLLTDPQTPLLYLLRNDLALNGPKYGCGIERCGSCMVLLDGKAMPSCMISGKEASAFDIVTLDGLGSFDKPHPVSEAFIEEQAAQCGYCINGMIICTKALLDENPSPDDQSIRRSLQRVLCRCGTHSRVISAVKKAAANLNKR